MKHLQETLLNLIKYIIIQVIAHDLNEYLMFFKIKWKTVAIWNWSMKNWTRRITLKKISELIFKNFWNGYFLRMKMHIFIIINTKNQPIQRTFWIIATSISRTASKISLKPPVNIYLQWEMTRTTRRIALKKYLNLYFEIIEIFTPCGWKCINS